MARPESVNDLPESDYRSLMATVYTSEFVDDPDITAAYAEFVRAAAGVGDIKHIGSTVELYRTKSADERDKDLIAAQRAWDGTKTRYEQVREGAAPRDFEKYSLRSFARNEGLPIPDSIAE
ncbi:DUF7432 family protein [Mycobacteroides abscessus]